MKYLLAIDQGTSSSRAIIFDSAARMIAKIHSPIQQIFPHSGWVEHDPLDYCKATQHCLDEILQVAGIKIQDIVSIGITNQRETTIIWDRNTGKPVYNAIVWQDRRTADYCEEMRSKGYENLINEKTGLLLDPYFSATKVKWILDNISGARMRAEKGELLFGTVDTYLLWYLTGGSSHMTDVTNASRTLLFNIKTKSWDEELLKLFDIPLALLPEVKPNGADFGSTQLEGRSVPITAMVGDQQAASFAQACLQPGMAKCTFGTGAFMLMNLGKQLVYSSNKLLTTVAYEFGNDYCYAMEGSIFVAGAAVQWLQHKLGLIEKASDSEIYAKQLDDNDGVYLVPAFAGLGAPYWDPTARGTIVGLSGNSSKYHIVRATLESIVYQTKDLLEAMETDTNKVFRLRVDGGMVKNDWLMQFLADMLNIEIERTSVAEATALGAAFMSGLQSGCFLSLDKIENYSKTEKIFYPSFSTVKRETLYHGWKKAVSKAQKNAAYS